MHHSVGSSNLSGYFLFDVLNIPFHFERSSGVLNPGLIWFHGLDSVLSVAQLRGLQSKLLLFTFKGVLRSRNIPNWKR